MFRAVRQGVESKGLSRVGMHLRAENLDAFGVMTPLARASVRSSIRPRPALSEENSMSAESTMNVDGKVKILSDGNAEFTRAIGLDLDASGFGLGTRSKRYAMVVEDGVVKSLMVEDVPTQAEKSSASAIVSAL